MNSKILIQRFQNGFRYLSCLQIFTQDSWEMKVIEVKGERFSYSRFANCIYYRIIEAAWQCYQLWGWNFCNNITWIDLKWVKWTWFELLLSISALINGLLSVHKQLFLFVELSKSPFSIVLNAQMCFPYCSFSRISTRLSISNPSFWNLSTSISLTSNSSLSK